LADGKQALCSWAMNVVGALCVDTSAQELKDVSADLTNVRKFVLDMVIKDLPTELQQLDMDDCLLSQTSVIDYLPSV
jgi:hypothetical protein